MFPQPVPDMRCISPPNYFSYIAKALLYWRRYDLYLYYP